MRWKLGGKAILFSCSWTAAPHEPTPPRKWCVPCGFSAWSWAWWARFGYGAFIFSSCLLSGGYFAEFAGLSQCDACPHTRSALPALGHEGKFPDGPNISRAQGNRTLRGRLRGNNVCKFTGEALTFVTQAYNIFFKGKISWPAWLPQSLEIVNAS